MNMKRIAATSAALAIAATGFAGSTAAHAEVKSSYTSTTEAQRQANKKR